MLERFIRKFFILHGRFCAEHPSGVFVVAALICAGFMIGMIHLHVEQSPVHLWVEPQSRTAADMTYFNDAYRPFFRIEEVVLTAKSGDNVVTNAAVLESMAFHEALLSSTDPVSGLKLDDICWRPLAGKGCLVQSWLNFFQEDVNTVRRLINISNDLSAGEWLYHCVSNPVSQPCFSSLGLPTEPITVFGSGRLDDSSRTYAAGATLMTYLVENSNNETYVQAVRSWEQNVFLRLAEEWSLNASVSGSPTVNRMAERSVQDALVDAESNNLPILFSYCGMFVYISIALGYFSKIHSKVQAAFTGIIIVLLSIASSVGLCSAIGVPMTLIIIDVIPFLLLAIGVDNMFIISNEFWFRCRVHLRRQPPGTPLSKASVVRAMSEALGEVGGTIFLAGASEGLAFSLGALTSMPAVRAFCLYSGVAILVNLLLQLTVFVAFLTLDARRAATGRFDAAPCFRHALDEESIAKANPMFEEGDDDPDYPLVNSPLTPHEEGEKPRSFSDAGLFTLRQANSVESVVAMQNHKERIRDEGLRSFSRLVRTFLREYYVPKFLFNRAVQVGVVVAFLAFGFQMLFYWAPQSELGLRQTDPIPDNFYLRDTLLAIENYLEVGPLIYFASPAPHQPLINFSHPNVIPAMNELFSTLRHDTAYVEPSTVASWFNDFRYFLCYFNQGSGSEVSARNFTVGQGCIDLPALNVTPSEAGSILSCRGNAQQLPVSWFIPALKQFLNAPQCCYESGTNTGVCGFQYDQEVIIGPAYVAEDGNMYPVPDGADATEVNAFEYITASRIRAQTVRLSSNQDYIGSLASAYNTTDVLNSAPTFSLSGLSVFPYSIYFVYYAQYLTLPADAGKQLAVAVAAVVVVTFLVLSSVSSTLSIALSILLILINMLGVMHWWEIDINAISIVNLVMCVGISVEFCAHIAVAFCGTKGPLQRRMMAAMVDMGSNVICGITLTKLLGVSILAFSTSEVFRKYYFRMYASIVVIGALHGLVFLPCLLLLVGSTLRLHRYKFATL